MTMQRGRFHVVPVERRVGKPPGYVILVHATVRVFVGRSRDEQIEIEGWDVEDHDGDQRVDDEIVLRCCRLVRVRAWGTRDAIEAAEASVEPVISTSGVIVGLDLSVDPDEDVDPAGFKTFDEGK